MFFTIYKTINLINGKIYIGKHITKNPYDKYMGSGNEIKKAIKKYGRKNFLKEVLFIFDNVDDMNSKERELITEIEVNSELYYNECIGGIGGNLSLRKGRKYEDFYSNPDDVKIKISLSKIGNLNPMYGKHHSTKTKKQMSLNTNLRRLTTESRKKAMKTRKERELRGLIKVGMKDRKHSEKTKEKIRLGVIKNHELRKNG